MVRQWMIDTLKVIAKFKVEHGGESPTIRQLMPLLGVASTNTVVARLARLRELGFIHLDGEEGSKTAILLHGERYIPPVIDDIYIARHYIGPEPAESVLDRISRWIDAHPGGEFTYRRIAEDVDSAPSYVAKLMREAQPDRRYELVQEDAPPYHMKVIVK